MTMLNQNVLVRTHSAGVHYGTLFAREGKEVTLTNARRLWHWRGAFTLSAVATKGVKEGSIISETVPMILLTEAIEIILLTDQAAQNLMNFPAHEV